MPIQRLNHAVLYVRDAQRSAAFYGDVLGFRRVVDMPTMVFLQAPGSTNDHDLGVFSVGEAAGPSTAGRQTVGLYHLAWEVDTLEELDEMLERARAYKAKDDRVDIVDKSAENHGPLTITSFYVGYLLPMMVEVQYFDFNPQGASRAPS